MRTTTMLRAFARTALPTTAAVALAAGLVSAPSYAADFSVTDGYVAPPMTEAAQAGNPFDGFYAGGHAGYGWANRHGCFGFSFPADRDCESGDFEYFNYDQKGWIAGGQIGYNHVFNGGLMLGAEVSASLSGITGNLLDLPDSDFEGVGDWTHLATATGKLGFAMDRLLIYGEAGLGLGGFRYNSDECNFSSNHQGWVAGVGGEVLVSPKNSLFVEYNHFGFMGKDADCAGSPDVAVYTKPSVDVVKFGFNHFFD